MIRIAEVGDKVLVNVGEKEGTFLEVTAVFFGEDELDSAKGHFTKHGLKDRVYYRLSDNLDYSASSCEIITPTETQGFYDEDVRSPHLLELGYKMLRWLEGKEDRPDNSKLPEIVTYLMAIQYDKEGFYGSSWKGKGEYRGIMANIDRKYDRLDKMTSDEINGAIRSLGELEKRISEGSETWGDVGESKIDAIADLTNYCLLYMTYVRENFPNVFRFWLERNLPAYLGENISFVRDGYQNGNENKN